MVVYIIIAVIVLVAAIFFYRKKRKNEMPAGLQIFDENGKLTFGMSKNTTYIIGQTSTNGASSGVVNDERIQGTVWIAITAKSVSNARFPIFSVTKGKISWRYWPYSDEPVRLVNRKTTARCNLCP